jgi:polyferredoxin
MWVAFIAGNALYYAVGITLAAALKDNRAFCKYICPMNVKIRDPKRSRENGAECILCFECAKVCPEKAI